MRFFLSGNIDYEIGDAFGRAQRKVEARLNKAAAGKNYGTAVDLIAVIPTISRRLPFGERRLFQRSKRAADYRLNIPYAKFRRSNTRGHEKLLVENALAAVTDLDRKAKAARLDFDGTRLALDIRKLFNLKEQPNNTSHSDARASSSLHKGRRARAGGRER